MSETPRALYLHGDTPLHVSLDGPALRVRKRYSDHRRFPLPRLARVATFGDVSWNSDALSACSDIGIVVCELRRDGSPSGSWVGPASSKSTFSKDWRHFMDRPEAYGQYRQWREATRQRAIQFCALQLRVGRQGAPQLLRQVRRRGSSDAHYRAAKQILYGIAFVRALEELTKLGLSDSDRSLALIAPDLAAVIQWGLHSRLSDWHRQRANPALPELAAFFERNGPTAAFHLRDALRALARLMTREM